jgi:tetratricopeptide (TPR) repeat protein
MRVWTLSLLLVAATAATASARQWTDATGRAKVDAELLDVQNNQVKLQFNESGKVVMMPLGTLSGDDQLFVQEWVARREAEREAAAGPPDRFTLAIKDEPTNPERYIERGMARTNKKDYDGAIKDFTKAIELNPNDGYAYNGRGLAYHNKGDLIAAQRDFNQALQLQPDLPSAYRNRGENLRKLALDPKQSVPELDEAIERWQQHWNNARQSNLKRAPWQPLNATKGDVSRQAALQQMAKMDVDFAIRLERDFGWDGDHGGHGGHGGCHGPGCTCEACSGKACPHCGGAGCAACGGGKPAPGLGVYPPECMKGETITLVANASQLAKGMPVEAKPGQKPDPNAPKIPVDSVDFYRDVDGDGLFNAESDQFLAADSNNNDGFSVDVSTDAFPPGPQSYFAVPRGAEGSGSGATPEELLAAAEAMEQAAQTQRDIAQACEAGKTEGMSEDQSKGVGGDQDEINRKAEEAAEKIAAAAPEVAELLKEAAKPMKAVKNLMNTAQKRPGEACKEDAAKASDKANEAAEKLADAASKLREAYEAAKASAAANPGQAPASAAAGQPTSGANEILAAAPIGTRGPGGDGDDGDDDAEDEIVVERALEYLEDEDYDNAVVEYDRLLEEDPDNLYLLRDRAAVNLARGGYYDAIQDYDHLLSIKDEPDADLYYNRGCAHLAAGRLEDAISDFTKSISLNETWSLAFNNRGVSYARLAQYQKAIEDFTSAIELEAGNKLAYRNRALAYKKLGEMRKAQADFDFVVKLEQGADNDPFKN